MSPIPEEILEHIFGYITDNRDRNTASLVCKSWYKVDKYSRYNVLIANCYVLSTDRLIGRFPAVRSLTIKGQRSGADFDLLPRHWGGSVHPWVVVLANTCADLQELRLKRMVVLDQTLELISTAFPNLKSLALISCTGFTANGLGAIAANCRFLEHLDLTKSKAEIDNGHWLSCFPESFTSLVSLNFPCLRGAVNLVDLEKLVARCPNLRNLSLSKQLPLANLSKIAMLAPQLVELGIGPQGTGHDVPPHLPFWIGPHVVPQPVEFGIAPQVGPQLADLGIQHRQSRLLEPLRNWKSLRSLSVSDSHTFRFLLQISSICSKLISLDISSLPRGFHCGYDEIIKHCHRLQRLWIIDSIGDEGLFVLSSTCKDLRDLRIFQSDPIWSKGGVTEEGLVSISKGCPLLHSLHFFCHQMTNAALITLSKNCPNIKCFRLSISESMKPDHVTLQPLDEGFGAIVQSCKALRRLSLSGLLTDQVFLYIGRYAERLEVLSAAYAGDSDRGMVYVLNGCRNLRKLEVTGCPFGDDALLANIGRCETMRCLYMIGCEITLGGCKALARKVPLMNVEVINGPNVVKDYPEDRDYPEDSFKVTKLYVYWTRDGPRDDAPEHVWILYDVEVGLRVRRRRICF